MRFYMNRSKGRILLAMDRSSSNVAWQWVRSLLACMQCLLEINEQDYGGRVRGSRD